MSLTLSAQNPRAPKAPSGIETLPTSSSSIIVQWEDQSEDELGFKIWRRGYTVGGGVSGDWYLAGQTPAGMNFFEDGGLAHSTAYEHKVAAWNNFGESDRVISVKPARTPTADRGDRGRIIAEMRFPFQPNNPSCVELEDGTLLLAYHRARVMHRRKYAQTIVMRSSSDGGATWTEERVALSTEDQSLVGTGKPALCLMSDGRLGMTFSRWLFKGKGDESVDRIENYARMFVASADQGLTWSEPVLVSDEASAKNHSLVLGDSGRLIHALGNGAIAISDDQGASWVQSFKIEAMPGMGPIGESSVTHLGNGRLVWIGRHEAPFYPVSRSFDNGETWEPVRLLYCGGGDNPPAIAAIPETNTVVALIHSWYDGRKRKDRRQLGAYISYDTGTTWGQYRQIEYNSITSGYQQPAISFFGDHAVIFYGGGIGSYGDADESTNLKFLKLPVSYFAAR